MLNNLRIRLLCWGFTAQSTTRSCRAGQLIVVLFLGRLIVGILMGANCAPLVADLFLFCYEIDFMASLFDVKQAEIIEAFKSTSIYLDDLLNIDNPYFEGMVNRIYPPELQLNKANTSDTEAPFLDLHLSISNGFVSSKIYDKRDYFDFHIVNFPFLDGDVPRSTSYGVYISQLIRFARMSSHVISIPIIKLNCKSSSTGLAISYTSKDFLQILSPTLCIGF